MWGTRDAEIHYVIEKVDYANRGCVFGKDFRFENFGWVPNYPSSDSRLIHVCMD